MIGANKLILNKATVNQALQDWVDKHLADKPKVEDVLWVASESAFHIKVDSTPKPPAFK